MKLSRRNRGLGLVLGAVTVLAVVLCALNKLVLEPVMAQRYDLPAWGWLANMFAAPLLVFGVAGLVTFAVLCRRVQDEKGTEPKRRARVAQRVLLVLFGLLAVFRALPGLVGPYPDSLYDLWSVLVVPLPWLFGLFGIVLTAVFFR